MRHHHPRCRPGVALAACALALACRSMPVAVPRPVADAAAGAPPPIAWPERPEHVAKLVVRDGAGQAHFVDHGLVAGGRLQELVFDARDEPLDISIAAEIPLAGATVLQNLSSFTRERRDDEAEWGRLLLYNSIAVAGPGEKTVSIPRSLDHTLLAYQAAAPRPPRGLAVMVMGLLGEKAGVSDVRERLHAAGWDILWISPPMRTLHSLAVRMEDADDVVARAAKKVAERIDDMLAERAFAAEALVEHVSSRFPASDEIPIVVVGFSMGAFAAPAVVERLPRPPAAVVLVGGGAELSRILARSSLMHGEGVRFGDRAPTDEEWEALHEEVLEHTHLDPAKLAPRLRDIPVLQIHAALDRIVPASTGDRLHELLGRPERWTYPLGHIPLFLWLGFLDDDIVEWIEAQVARGAEPAPYSAG